MDYYQNVEIYQIDYDETTNACSIVRQLPNPFKVIKSFDPIKKKNIFSVYWPGADYSKLRQAFDTLDKGSMFVITYPIPDFKSIYNYIVVSMYTAPAIYLNGMCRQVCNIMFSVYEKYASILNNIRKRIENYKERNNVMQNKYDVPLLIRSVYYNEPNTVVKWSDGTQTVVGCSDKDSFDKEIGLAVAIAEKYFQTLGLPHPRAALKTFAKSGIDQTEKTRARKAFKDAKKKLHEKDD